ncbi:hypothetical protein C9374_006559 [Naegleria lovaniensis]|uniref:Uncharacterized protein n=1 Tax=Naegleria lovaniensis TaxID=51637 RepID=A0AA88GL76_NAELO|nr:uncharacterized protein C9374_006559 [Naegleria lovaniensis]KAG2379442.1 hypothetical protein C9374_006559 [Naegleria lovaniensis]
MGCGASSQKHVAEPSTPHKVANSSKMSHDEEAQKGDDHQHKAEERVVAPSHQQQGSSSESTEDSKKNQQQPPSEEIQEEKAVPPPSDHHKDSSACHHNHGQNEEKSVPPKKRIKEEEDDHQQHIAQPPSHHHEPVAGPPELEHPENVKESEEFVPPEYGEEEEKAASIIQKKYKEFSAKKKVDRMLMCYLCGQKFGPTSLPIHLKPHNCPEQRMNDMKANLPKELVLSQLPSPPQHPIPDAEKGTQEEVDAYNNEAYEIYTKQSMIHCPICSKGFEIDRLTKHLQICKDKDGHTWEEHQAAIAIQKNWNKHLTKKMLFCYCCGQEYGTKSLPIHIPECIKKREAIWKHSGLPEDLIKPIPEAPHTPIPGSSDPSESFKSYNTEARTIYIASMAQCPGCHRKFEPDRLVVHLHSCHSVNKENPVN